MASKPCLPVSRRRKVRDDDGSAIIAFDDIQSMDASEYLSRVVLQSSRLPEILVPQAKAKQQSQAPSPEKQQQQQTKQRCNSAIIEGSAASLSYLVSNRTALLPPPTPKHLPANSAEWVDQTLANFSQLRLYLDSQIVAAKKGNPQQNGQQRQRQPVPPMKDRPGWHIFCLGKKEARGNMGSYFADDEDDDDAKDNDDGDDDDSDAAVSVNKNKSNEDSKKKQHQDQQSEATSNNHNNDNAVDAHATTTASTDSWQHNLPEHGYHPTTSLILQLDQVMVRKVISHLAHYLQEGWYPCSPQRTLWLYSLLARLEKPIHRNDAAVMYSMLKVLTRARAAMNLKTEDTDNNAMDTTDHKNDKNQREELARLNVLITIIGIYFQQGGGYAGVMETTSTL